MSYLTKTEVLLHRVLGTRYQSEDGQHVCVLSADTYNDMLQPDTITMTVVPGDQLNSLTREEEA